MRARNVKPGFFSNEDLAELDFPARLLFIGLWCLADRKGRLEERPKRIASQVFPYDPIDVRTMLANLARLGFITRYSSNGSTYIEVVNFERHQRPHNNETPSVIPDPKDCQILPPDATEFFPPRIEGLSTKDQSTSLLISDSLNDDSLNKEIRQKNGSVRDGEFEKFKAEIAEAWQASAKSLKHPSCRFATKEVERHLGARFKEPEWMAHWREALTRLPWNPWRLKDGKQWTTLEWFTKPDTVAKLMEMTGPIQEKSEFKKSKQFEPWGEDANAGAPF